MQTYLCYILLSELSHNGTQYSTWQYGTKSAWSKKKFTIHTSATLLFKGAVDMCKVFCCSIFGLSVNAEIAPPAEIENGI